MQHIGLELTDENNKLIERSNINFAPVITILSKINDYQEFIKAYPFLDGIDPYGLTYFNVHQAPRVIEELEKLMRETTMVLVQKEIIDTIDFLKKVEQHTFAQFIGD